MKKILAKTLVALLCGTCSIGLIGNIAAAQSTEKKEVIVNKYQINETLPKVSVLTDTTHVFTNTTMTTTTVISTTSTTITENEDIEDNCDDVTDDYTNYNETDYDESIKEETKTDEIVENNESTYAESSYTEIDMSDRRLLAEITTHEYGSDWVSTEEKAKIVAAVMNRVNSEDYPDTVYDVLMQDGQFHGDWDGGAGYYPGTVEPTGDCIDAVDYYFEHQDEYGNYTSWSGDGSYNYFY